MDENRVERAPVLLTERLRLRPHRADDLNARTAIAADPAVYRFIVGSPQSREDVWARIQRYAGMWALDGFGLFAVEERATGGLVGEVGLARFGRGLGPDFDDAPEGAWIIASGAARQGFAREATAAALAWYEGRFGPTRQVCVIAEENVPSLTFAERLGFRPFRDAHYRERAVILLERLPLPGEGL